MVSKEAVAVGACAGAASLIAVPAAISFTLGLFGFGATGVLSGSVAAGIQAGIGNVVAGSTFATLQSIAAAGVAKTTVVLTATGVAATAGAVTNAFNTVKFW